MTEAAAKASTDAESVETTTTKQGEPAGSDVRVTATPAAASRLRVPLAVWRELQRRDASLRIGEKYALNRRASRVAARIARALNIQSAK